MLSRRTRSRLDFLVSVAALAFQVLLWRKATGIERRYRSGELESLDLDDRLEDADGVDRETVWIAMTETVRDDGRVAIRPGWVAVGLVRAVVTRRLVDHDVVGVRRSWRRRATFSAANALVWAPLEFGDSSRAFSMGLGMSTGAAWYRLRYGVLGELPGE